MKCPVCGVDLDRAPGHWSHGYDDCSVRVYATKEDLENDLLPWGVKKLFASKIDGPIIVNRTLTLLHATATEEEQRDLERWAGAWLLVGVDRL